MAVHPWGFPAGLEEFVRPTGLADSGAEPIQDALTTILDGAGTGQEAAVRIYYFVRDEVRFATTDVGLRASQALRIRKGQSLVKGTLAIAMFRGAGIPARYRLIDADERRVRGIVDPLSFAMFPTLRRIAPQRTVLHVIPQVFLDGRWLNADPLFDRRFFDGLKRRDVEALRAVEGIDWDGTSDQSPQEHWVKRELGVCANADEIIAEWTRYVRYLYYVGAFYPFERYINRVRQG